MLSEEQVFEQFRSRGVGGSHEELYLPKASSLEFIKACDRNDLAVVGLEGFKYEDGKLLPQLDLIADYSLTTAASWSSYRQRCNNSAQMFIEESDARENFCFSFTVISQQESK
jgi:hypothetical protein